MKQKTSKIEEDYCDPIIRFIDNMETAFEKFCDWLRRIYEMLT